MIFSHLVDLFFNYSSRHPMRKSLFVGLSVFMPAFLFGQNSQSDSQFDAVFRKYTQWFIDFIFYEIPFAEEFKVPWVVLILIGGAIYFTFYFRLINFTGVKTAIRVIKGDYTDIEAVGADVLYEDVTKDEQKKVIQEAIQQEEAAGEVTHFQALTTALSATVGLGNIAGVAVAISIGGPGATFWMIIGGLLGMATKFTECTLGVKYRDVGPDGTIYGGPMYYLRKGLAEKGMKNFGKILAFSFAVLITCGAFGIGNLFQANQASAQFANLFDLNASQTLWVGAGLAIIVAMVIIGGIKRIAKVTEKLVPFMAVLYILSALIIIGVNYMHLGDAFIAIFKGAFTGEGIAGGAVGVMVQGIRRSTFSNEAGMGSAPTAHAAVKTKYPASEGLVALLEPFIDTVVICTLTALIIIIANFDANIVVYGKEISEGVQLTAAAFDSAIPNFSIALTIAVILFAISTMISWSYYGVQGWMYIFGKGKRTRLIYNILFCFGIWIGSGVSLDAVIDFSDAMNFGMAIPNIIGVIILASVVRKELKRYLKAIKIKDKALDKGLEDVKDIL